MKKKYAKKLHNGDEVKVRVEPKQWISGYIVGNVMETFEGIFVNVQAETNGYLSMVHHTDLK